MQRPRTTIFLVLAIAAAIGIDVARADVSVGVGGEAGWFAGGRLWKAEAGQSREWIVPDGSISYFGEEATVEMESFAIGGLSVVARSDTGWGVIGRIVFSDIGVKALIRDGRDAVETFEWDQYFVVNAQVVGTWSFAPGAPNTPYVLGGLGFSNLSSEGGAANQSGANFVFGGGWRFGSRGTILDIEVRDTIMPLDFDDEEARLRERVLPEDGFEAESLVHMIEASARVTFSF